MSNSISVPAAQAPAQGPTPTQGGQSPLRSLEERMLRQQQLMKPSVRIEPGIEHSNAEAMLAGMVALAVLPQAETGAQFVPSLAAEHAKGGDGAPDTGTVDDAPTAPAGRTASRAEASAPTEVAGIEPASSPIEPAAALLSGDEHAPIISSKDVPTAAPKRAPGEVSEVGTAAMPGTSGLTVSDGQSGTRQPSVSAQAPPPRPAPTLAPPPGTVERAGQVSELTVPFSSWGPGHVARVQWSGASVPGAGMLPVDMRLTASSERLHANLQAATDRDGNKRWAVEAAGSATDEQSSPRRDRSDQ